jgi:hypothetical protein
MNLDEAQRKAVAGWIKEGLKLSDIQNRMASELGLRLTYMEVRLLVDDLRLVPKDVERPKPVASTLNTSPTPTPAGAGRAAAGGQTGTPKTNPPAPAAAPPGSVSVSVDQIARPGAVVSGQVTFSDGQKAGWYIDQTGRLGLAPQQTGYRPSAADLQQFQMALEGELSRMGF